MTHRLTIRPFDDTALPQAAQLLAARHRRDRQHTPLLSPRYAEETAAAAMLAPLWPNERTSGAAAWHGDRLVGYLLSEIRIDGLRGRYAWAPSHGHALAEDQSADLYADLYAAAGEEWLHWGAFDHYTIVPATDDAALATWFSLSFGQQQAEALLALDDALPSATALPGMELRLATAADKDRVVNDLAFALRDHLTLAPVWGVGLPEYAVAMREGFAELMDDPQVCVWLALEGDRPLAYQIYVRPEDDDMGLALPDSCVILHLAATLPEARGRGIGRALTAAGLVHARGLGYTSCTMDWRTTNREARRFWTSLGFQAVSYRLVRSVDSRITWARLPGRANI